MRPAEAEARTDLAPYALRIRAHQLPQMTLSTHPPDIPEPSIPGFRLWGFISSEATVCTV
jgi:hypothetical protein